MRATRTAVHIAAQNGHTELITTLHAAGANISNPTNVNCETPVFIAAQNGHAEAIRTLYALGANVNTRDKYGWTPAYIAAQNGHAKAIAALHAAKANVNTPWSDKTPLYMAAENGHASCVKTLLELRADASVNTRWGTALQIAKQGKKPQHAEIIEILEAHLGNDMQGSLSVPMNCLKQFHQTMPSSVSGRRSNTQSKPKRRRDR